MVLLITASIFIMQHLLKPTYCRANITFNSFSTLVGRTEVSGLRIVSSDDSKCDDLSSYHISIANQTNLTNSTLPDISIENGEI